MCSLFEILSAALTPAIGITVAYVAYQQWRTNDLRRKHELFDQRFEIYKTVQIYLSRILVDAKVNNEITPALIDAKQRSRFLMGTDIERYLDEVYKHGNRLTMYQKKLKGEHDPQKRSELVEKEDDELTWLTDQLPTLAERFQPYLCLAGRENFLRQAIRWCRSSR